MPGFPTSERMMKGLENRHAPSIPATNSGSAGKEVKECLANRSLQVHRSSSNLCFQVFFEFTVAVYLASIHTKPILNHKRNARHDDSLIIMMLRLPSVSGCGRIGPKLSAPLGLERYTVHP